MIWGGKIHHYIYKVTNNITGKIYIGQHQTYRKYDYYLGSGKYILKAIKKYGKENFTKEILEECIPCRHYKDLAEIRYIREYNCIHPNGYNLSSGGNGPIGYKHTDETKLKLSILGKGRLAWNKGLKGVTTAWNKGIKNSTGKRDPNYVHSEETRLKISMSNSGKIRSEEFKSKVSKSLIGKQVSDSTRLKLSESAFNRKTVECPICGKIGQKPSMIRWHFENCKHKKNK